MLVRSRLRTRLMESDILHLSGLDPEDLLDATKGIPNYHPSELPKIHIGFDTATSEEDTLDRSISLVETGLSIRLFLRCEKDFRKVLEDYSLEITYRLRSTALAETIDKMIDLAQVGTIYEIDSESNPIVGRVVNQYTMRYRI